MTGEATSIDLLGHPLLTVKGVQFQTRAFDKLVEVLTEWLWSGATGGFIVGAPRIGKSWSARSLTNRLRLRDGKVVPVFYMSIVDRDIKSIAEVPRRACIDHQLPITGRANADRLAEQFLTHVCDVQTEAGVRTSILIVDEFDHLIPRQFNAFAELFNRLDQLHRMIMVVFIGNKAEARKLLEAMTGGAYKRIRGRFFQRFHEYHGIRTRDELTALMTQYDTLRYPENGPTYCATFLPEAVNGGWRLAGLSKDLWRQYAEIAKACELRSWGMEYVIGTLNILVTDLLPYYGWKDVDDELLREAVLITHVADDFVQALPVEVIR
ncbi:ATP-binding protein [Marinobacter panjinensis]|uniref:ATP-binding protein n=1 Tax=Marinobacter panjinensis TaxID=2576384 RepID=A0A4V6CTV9_9GAMM|nr:ATP-binding protein [Marinobacter panjinensis]MCR8916043.1 ATP-binding protein [Marinobacter panjinensis]TKV66995.1 ATP-binding protein [Marinobacter panjinensis]